MWREHLVHQEQDVSLKHEHNCSGASTIRRSAPSRSGIAGAQRICDACITKKRGVRLFRDDNLDSAFPPQYVDADILRVTFKREVNYSVSYLEILYLNVLQERRQDRL